MLRLCLGLVPLLLALACGQVHAQAWPAKPVRLIVAFAPGAQPDIIARLLADRLSRSLGQQLIVDNRPGAANLVGVVAPAGTPAEAVQRFARETGGILRDPEVVQRLRDMGTYTVEAAQSPEGFADYMRTERVYWDKLLKEIGVEPE